MAKYTVKDTSILHNKKIYAEGSEIELTDEQAKRLENFVDPISSKTSETGETKTQSKNQTSKSSKNKSETKSKTEETATNNGNIAETSETKTDINNDGDEENDK